MGGPVRIKRIYDPPAEDNGLRVLVDRIWPRGVKKESAALDRWIKDVAPSAELRRWFHRAPDRWPAFKARYAEELAGNPGFGDLRKAVAHGPVTLVFAARDVRHNNAAALAEFLAEAARA